MKTLETIAKDYERIENKITANQAEIEKLSLIWERRAAADAKQFDRVKALREESKANAEKIAVLSDEIEMLKIKQYILAENRRAVFAADALPIILKAFSPYNGKKYGEKTSEKIRAEVKAQNIGFWIESDGQTANVYQLHDGFRTGASLEVKIFSTYEKPFISKENVIQAATAETSTHYHYIEDPGKRAKEIRKAFKKLEKAHAAAKAAESEYNALLPERMKHSREIGYYVSIF